jgi:hypothetical protein
VQLGIGGWQSYDAIYVEKNKFGDCKALSTFMKGLLQEVGIESWQAVINWDEEPTLMAKDFASHYFNHMMLHIPSVNMWLECTSSYFPTGMIDKFTEDKQALLITPDGGILTQTPGTPVEENIIRTIDTLYLDDSWHINGQCIYSGNTQGDIRQVVHYIKASDQRKRFLEKYPLQVRSLESLTYDVDQTGQQSGYSYSLELRDFGSSSGGRLFIPLNSFHTIGYTCTASQTRTSPFISYDDHTLIHEVYIKIPGSYIPEFLPETKIITHALGHYSLSASIQGEYLHITRSLQFIPAHIPPDQYAGVCKFYEDIKKADGTKIVFISRT